MDLLTTPGKTDSLLMTLCLAETTEILTILGGTTKKQVWRTQGEILYFSCKFAKFTRQKRAMIKMMDTLVQVLPSDRTKTMGGKLRRTDTPVHQPKQKDQPSAMLGSSLGKPSTMLGSSFETLNVPTVPSNLVLPSNSGQNTVKLTSCEESQ
jgi:hypothetical protein